MPNIAMKTTNIAPQEKLSKASSLGEVGESNETKFEQVEI